ncbi:Uncharacterized protein SCF082_LOCUS33137 [Durusdinium trenchii]|uniref:Uncharacterized protein n=2 Tax=Durusdinium trenchii TaxID=1381693 RepID=A0ABP0NKK6_9DINO
MASFASRASCAMLLCGLAAGGVLEQWLEDLQVTLPKGTVPPVEADVKIFLATVHVKATLDSLVCEGFQVGHVESTPHAAKEGLQVSVQTQKITVFCAGEVEYSTSVGLSGVADAQLRSAGAAGGVELLVPPWSLSQEAAPEIGLLNCQATPKLELKITSGSFWTQFAHFLPGVIQKIQTLTNQKVSEYLCSPASLASAHKFIHEWMQRSLTSARTWNVSEPPALQANWVDWTQHTLTKGIVQFQEQFLEPTGVYNWLIAQRCLVGAATTCFTAPICVLGNSTKNCAAPNGSFGLVLPEMRWNMSDFLITPLMLQNASIAANLSASRFHLQPTLNITYMPKGLEQFLGGTLQGAFAEAVAVNLTFSAVRMAANMTLGVDQAGFSQVPSFQYLESECLGSHTEALSLTRFRTWFQLEQIALSSDARSLLASLLTLSGQLLAPAGGLQNFSAVLLEGFFQNQFAPAVNQSMGHWLTKYQHQTCPLPKGQGVYDPTGRILIRPTFGRVCCWVALGTAVLALLLGAIKRGPRSYSHWFSGALCQCETVPRSLAVMLPVLILACLCFLLGSNYLLMAQTFVNLEQAPFFVWNAYQVMVYSLFYSIDALYYEAHLQAMSWVLLCFSAILPYVKLVMMLICWLTPRRLLPLRLRSWIVVIMDDIGKFSLVDVFTVQFLSGVFHIEVSGVNGSETAPLRMVLRTNEELGFAAFVFATVVSLIIGHLCRHYHQTSAKHFLNAACNLGDVELQEQVSSLGMPLSGVEASSSRRSRWQLLIGPGLVLTLALCIVGCFLPAFSVKLHTVFGPLGSSQFSLFQFACMLPSFAEHPRSFPALFNQAKMGNDRGECLI